MKSDLERRIEVSLGRVYRPGDDNSEMERLANIFLGGFFRDYDVDVSSIKVKTKIVGPGCVEVNLKFPGVKK